MEEMKFGDIYILIDSLISMLDPKKDVLLIEMLKIKSGEVKLKFVESTMHFTDSDFRTVKSGARQMVLNYLRGYVVPKQERWDKIERLQVSRRSCDDCQFAKEVESSYNYNGEKETYTYKSQDYDSPICDICCTRYQKLSDIQDTLWSQYAISSNIAETTVNNNPEIVRCMTLISRIKKKLKEIKDETN